MKTTVSIVLSAVLAACAGTQIDPESPALAFAQAGSVAVDADPSAADADPSAAVAGDELTIVEVEIVKDEAEPEMICRKTTRPGSRVVVGETCYPKDSVGLSAQTRDDLQRELSGRGMQAGWKSEQQINAERAIGGGFPRR